MENYTGLVVSVQLKTFYYLMDMWKIKINIAHVLLFTALHVLNDYGTLLWRQRWIDRSIRVINRVIHTTTTLCVCA